MKKNYLTFIAIAFFALFAGAKGSHPGLASVDSSSVDATAPSDGEIAAIVMAANNDEIEAAKVAQSKAQTPEVKSFADEMVLQHQDVNNKVSSWAKEKSIRPKDNREAKELKKHGAQEMAKLNSLSGKEFDKAYADAQVKDHEKVLADLDKKLIPAARDSELRELLTDIRPHVETHLSEAKKMQSAIK